MKNFLKENGFEIISIFSIILFIYLIIFLPKDFANIDSVWFYAFSTIAQVMAALVALFAVFVIFKLDKLNDEIKEFRDGTIDVLRDLVVASNDVIGMQDHEVFQKGKKYIEDLAGGAPARAFYFRSMPKDKPGIKFSKEIIDSFGKLLMDKNRIIKNLKNTLFLSIIPISLSITFLVLTSYLKYWEIPLLLFVLMITLLALLYIGRNIYSIAKY